MRLDVLRTSSGPWVVKLQPDPLEAPKGLCLSDTNYEPSLMNDALRLQRHFLIFLNLVRKRKSQLPPHDDCIY